VFHNWKTSDSGYISMAQALIESCDTVFYRIGFTFYTRRQIYGEIFQKDLRASGLGRDTGIDLPSENAGLVPTRDWKVAYAKEHPSLFHPDERQWLPGDDINMAIGQGFLQVTPLQMATVFSAIANGGTLYQPHVAMEAKRPDGTVVTKIPAKVTGHLPYTRGQLSYIREALRGVPVSGTAATAFVGFPLSQFPVAGKTGTADIAGRQPYSWFVAMAPADHPRYVVAVVVEQGGHGSQTAAPVVRRILEGLFGLPVEDSLQAGVLVD
jgi:penicillin-binding protein 2